MKKIAVAILSLLFLSVSSPAQERPAEDRIVIAAVGDIMLGGRAEPFLKEFGPAYPFGNIMSVLSRADLVAGNLESAISLQGVPVPDKTFTLRVGPIATQTLLSGNIKVVSLANNHSMDFGPLALRDTLQYLDDAGILYTGAGLDIAQARVPAIVKIKGRTLAFLSYSLTFPLDFYASQGKPGTAPGYADFVKADIEKVRPRADLVVVSFHWGAELMTAAKDYQIELGHQAVDWGADLVLGHHPHVLQELELYKGRLIAYSLGNFIFGSESNRTNSSMILLLTFQGNALARVEAVPLDVNNYRVKYQPRILKGQQAADVLNALNVASGRFKTSLTMTNDRGVLEIAAAQSSSDKLEPKSKNTLINSAATASAPRN
jgi:poly-gamma-glutamate capsule biosynthesis protein CapA/YwtB (metallophosphatase superfamily)